MSDTDFDSRGDQYLNRKLFEPALVTRRMRPGQAVSDSSIRCLSAGHAAALMEESVSFGIGGTQHWKVRNPLYRLPPGEGIHAIPRSTANNMRRKISVNSTKLRLTRSHRVHEISQFSVLGTAGRWFESSCPDQ